ncbi:MAG: hypothetical protein QW717_06220 [Candidatus Bathyarchaeia archaeon]
MKLPTNVDGEKVLFSIILALGFGFYLYVLTRHPLIYGIDGPYYLTQVRSLLENGCLKYGDPPLAFFIFAFFTLLSGGNITLGIKVGVALFSALSAAPLYFWVKRVTGFKLSWYAAMFTCIFSSLHIRLINGLLKNAVGAFFLICFAYYLHLLFVGKGSRRVLFAAAVFLLLTGATHILDFGVALLFLTLYPSAVLLAGINRRDVLKKFAALLLTVVVFSVVVLASSPFFFSDFYKGLAFLQAMLSENSEGLSIQFLFDPMGGFLILPVLTVGVVLSVHEWRNKNKQAALSLATVTIVGVLLSLPIIPPEWLSRFLLMEFIPVAFVLGYSFSKMNTNVAAAILLVLCVFPMFTQAVAVSRTLQPTIEEIDYREIESMREYVLPNSVIVGDPRYGYWVEYITRADVAKMLSPELRLKYTRILLLVDKLSFRQPPIPPYATKIFEGRRFILFKVISP